MNHKKKRGNIPARNKYPAKNAPSYSDSTLFPKEVQRLIDTLQIAPCIAQANPQNQKEEVKPPKISARTYCIVRLYTRIDSKCPRCQQRTIIPHLLENTLHENQ